MTRRKQVAKSNARRVTKKNPIQDAVNLFAAAMECLGFDLEDENFDGTPERFVRYLQEFRRPFEADKLLKIGFGYMKGDEQGYKGMLAQPNVPFRTICPHHLLPVVGRCHIGYIPGGRVVGLSKLTRLVYAVGSEMPRMQETATDVIADILEEKLKARGVIVVISSDHGCMTGRGVRLHDAPAVTSTVRGLFRDVPSAKEEFFEMVKLALGHTH
jgi:GTP cyclohydrolase I